MDQETFFSSPLQDFVTLADMARELRASIEQVKLLVEQHQVRPVRRHGVVRLWDRAAMESLRKFVDHPTATLRK